MNKGFKILAAGLLLLSAGCSSNGSTSDVDPIETYGCDVINVYNWGEYIGEDVVSNFEKTYNVRVH